MRIYKDGKWHCGCDSCGEFIEDCICEKDNKKKKEMSLEQSERAEKK